MARKPEDLAHGTQEAFDLGDWHDGPTCVVQFLPNTGNGGLYAICVTHRVTADVEAVGVRITHEASKKGA